MTFTITMCDVGWILAIIGWSFIAVCTFAAWRGWDD